MRREAPNALRLALQVGERADAGPTDGDGAFHGNPQGELRTHAPPHALHHEGRGRGRRLNVAAAVGSAVAESPRLRMSPRASSSGYSTAQILGVA